jgi:hypothetical protein
VIDGEAIEIIEESAPGVSERRARQESANTPRPDASKATAAHRDPDAGPASDPGGEEHLFDTAAAEAAAAGDEPYEDPA